MSEYLVTGKITGASGGTVNIPISSKVKGVYTSANVTIGWKFNGTTATIRTAVQIWEPSVAFEPAKTSYLVITSAAPVDITVRME